MVVCAFAVLAPVAEETDATATDIAAGPLKDKAQVDGTLTYDETSKIYTIGSVATITLKSDVELKQVRFAGSYALTVASEATAVKTLTVNYDFNGKTGENNIFAVSSLTLNNVNLTVVQNDTGRTTGPGEDEPKNSVFGNMAVTVDGKSIMTVTCDENSNRVFYNNSSTLTINGATAKVVMDRATSMTVKLVMTGDSTLEIKNPRGTAGNFYPAITNGGNSKITVTDGSNSTIRFYANDGSTGIASLEGVTITADCPVALYNNTNNTSNAAGFTFNGSTINATKVVIAQSGTNENGVTLKNGTFNVDAISDESISNPYKTNPPAITPVFTLDGTIFKGQTAVDAGVTLLGTASFSAIGDSLEFAKGAKLGNGTTGFTIENAVNGSTNTVTLTAAAGENGLRIVAGSVEITGTLDAHTVVAKIEAAGGDVVLKDLTITAGTLTIDNTVAVQGNLDVASGATLNVASGATLNVASGATLSVYGTVSGTVKNNGTVEAVNGGNLNSITFDPNGTGTVTSKTDDSEKENINIDGTIKGTENTYDADQIVTINGDTRIVEGAVLTINGTLIVKEGVTLTLEAGSRLVIANNAVMDIQGTVVVEESYGVVGEAGYVPPAEFEIRGNVAVYGALNVNGTVTFVTGTVSVEQDGVVDILEEGEIAGTPSAYKFVVKASGTLNVAGSIATMGIENSGTVTFDSKVESGNVTVDMKNGAVLDVKNITLANGEYIDIKDAASTDAGNEVKVSATSGKKASTNSIVTADPKVSAVISGISVSEAVTSKTMSGSTTPTYTYVMTVSGSAAVSPIYLGTGEEPSIMVATATVELTGFATTTTAKSKLAIAEGLTVGENVTLDNKGTLDVTVVVDATKGTVNNTGKITVSGNGSIVVKQERISNDAKINASKYSVADTTTSDKTYYYVTLDNALAAAATGTTKDITVLGKQTLAASADLVSGATMNIDGATLVIGSGDNASDVVLTVKSGATVKGTPVADSETEKAIDVKGTVSAENKRDIKTGATDALNEGAAVYSEEMDDRNRPVSNGWAKWTNVYTAMGDSTLTVVKLINGIILDKNLTIPEGKTLDTDGKNVTAKKNVVVTVEGTLDIGSPSQIYLKKPSSSETTDKTASIVVKGLIESDADLDSDDGVIRTGEEKYLPLGAYYTVDGKFCMTTVEKAAAIISTVDEQTVTIKGTENKLTVAGDIAFAGTDEGATVDVELSEIAFSGSVSIDNATITFVAAAKVSGTFANASGSVALKGQTVAQILTDDKALTIGSATVDGTAVLTVSGKLEEIPATATASKVAQTFTVTGAVSVSAITLDNAVVDGTLTVKGAANTVTTLTVNGSVVIDAGAELTSTTATVLGSLVASEKTSTAGDAVFNVHVLYIGTTENAVTGANASVTGKIVLTGTTTATSDSGASTTINNGYAVAAAGSTVPAGFTSEDNTFVSTAYYVDNGLFVTVYANDNTVVTIYNTVKASKDNAVFSAWSTVADDASKDVGRTAKIGYKEAVYAVFNYNIYKVIVIADNAVDNLYIDGNLMVKGYVNDGAIAFISGDAMLVAGNHTFSYTLKNGYSGEGTFKILSDGKSTVSGNTLTLAGNPDDTGTIDVKLQLTGFTASGYVDPTPETPSEKDDGLTITDYLLIILVVLIVIMAIIVAMRLMRS